MAEKPPNVGCCIEHPSNEEDDAYTRMNETLAEEAGVTREERGRLEPVQITHDLLLVLPLRAADFETDVVRSETPAAQSESLVARNVVIENDHAARRTVTSRTTPHLVSRTASRTAAAVTFSPY